MNEDNITDYENLECLNGMFFCPACDNLLEPVKREDISDDKMILKCIVHNLIRFNKPEYSD